MDKYGKSAMTKADIDEFNKKQIELKNRQKQNEQEMNLLFAE